MDDAIKRLRELREKALPGEWHTAFCASGESCWCRLLVNVPEPNFGRNDYETENCIACSGSIDTVHAEYFAALHNELPAILAALEAAEQRVREKMLLLVEADAMLCHMGLPDADPLRVRIGAAVWAKPAPIKFEAALTGSGSAGE